MKMEVAMTEWVTSSDVAKIAGCSQFTARKLIKQINIENIEAGFLVPNKYKVSKKQFLKRLGLKED